MLNELPLDVIDRILMHIPNFSTLRAVVAVSKQTYNAFSARPLSIFKAVLQNKYPASWPSITCLLHFKATGNIVEEAQAGDIVLDTTAISRYRLDNGDVLEFIERFERRYTVQRRLTDEQFSRVYRALYRLWLYQARFGPAWSEWMRTLSAAENARTHSRGSPNNPLPSLPSLGPESLAAGRSQFLMGLPRDEALEVIVVFHFLRQEVMQWLCTHQLVQFDTTDQMHGIARELVAHELPNILWTMFYGIPLDPVYNRYTEEIDDQFLFPSLLFYQEEFTHPEILILGKDHMCYLSCGLCKKGGRHLWHKQFNPAGYWGSAFEFADAFLTRDAWDDEGICDPFVDALHSRSYGYKELMDDVFRREGIVDGWNLLACDRCIRALLRRHVTPCWLKWKALCDWDEEETANEPGEKRLSTPGIDIAVPASPMS